MARESIIAQEQAEKKLKAKQYKAWREERKAANSSKLVNTTVASTTFSAVAKSESVDVSMLEAKIEERRLRWMQECLPWRLVGISLIVQHCFMFVAI